MNVLRNAWRRIRSALTAARSAAVGFDNLGLDDGYYTCEDRREALAAAERRRRRDKG